MEEINGWFTMRPWGLGLDADNDHMDEMMLSIAPTIRHVEWDPGSQGFVTTWTMEMVSGSSLLISTATDLDVDGIPEWCGSGLAASGGYHIVALEQRGAPLFADGFESGLTAWWSNTVPLLKVPQ